MQQHGAVMLHHNHLAVRGVEAVEPCSMKQLIESYLADKLMKLTQERNFLALIEWSHRNYTTKEESRTNWVQLHAAVSPLRFATDHPENISDQLVFTKRSLMNAIFLSAVI